MDACLKITDSEWKIMKVLWKNEPLELSGIIQSLKDDGVKWERTTVFTLLNRLVEKGAVHADKSKPRTRYSYAVDESECSLQEARSFLEKVYDGSVGMLVASFLKSKALSQEEISELRELLNKEVGEKND